MNPESRFFEVEKKIKAEAFRLGFSLCGITDRRPLEGYARYEQWIQSEHHAEMGYLASERHRKPRHDPGQLMPGVQSIISLGWPYPIRTMDQPQHTGKAKIACYANERDYHLTLIKKLTTLSDFIRNLLGGDVEIKGYTDSAPLLEREIASRAGLGWIGKNSNLISPKTGSAILLAELLVGFPLQADPPFQKDLCGNCMRCVKACPTQCILPDRTIDGGKCISYLTIENKGDIPENLRGAIGEWLFGCDVCQMVCPWNVKHAKHEVDLKAVDWDVPQVLALLDLSEVDFRNHFKEHPITRAKLNGMRRNALIWLGNNADPSEVPKLKEFADRSKDEGQAQDVYWAIEKIKERIKAQPIL